MRYKPFIYPTAEDITFGITDLCSFCIRWKSAEDGRTWMRPTFTQLAYGRWYKRFR